MREQGYPRLNILHSDIQGFELEMLAGAADSFKRALIDYVFISTHSQILHDKVVADLSAKGMRVEVSCAFDFDTTSHDGLVFASRPALPPMFAEFTPLGRRDILKSSSDDLISYITSVRRRERISPS